jgi:hypothetical protein
MDTRRSTVTDWWPETAGPGPHVASSPEQYKAAEGAYHLVCSYWRALADDDDATISAILLPTLLARFVGPGSGPATRIREGLGLTVAECRLIGPSTVVRFDSQGSFLLLCMKHRTGLGVDQYDKPALVKAWPMVVLESSGGWRMMGPTDASTAPATVGLIDVIPESDLPTA